MTIDVLLVEDEASLRLAMTQSFKLAGLSVTGMSTMEEATQQLDERFAGVVVADVRLPGKSGLDLLGVTMNLDRELPVILITGHGDITMAVQAIRQGAYDFLEKPFRTERLVDVVKRGLEKRRLVLENRALRQTIHHKDGLPELIGQSAPMQKLKNFIATIGPINADVMINGETGTGKEVVARHLHAAANPNGPFVAINCAAMPETMFESEMFGHEAGAFTGAHKRRIGKFEFARGGTIFLDEIESMPLALQAKLLRVLQERTLERLGGNAAIAIDCRVVAASKMDFMKLAEQGQFRADLYYRIATVSVELPPLRERPADIGALLTHFVNQACSRYQRAVPDWTTTQLQAWSQRPWPGNVRELKGFADRLVLGVPDTDDASTPAFEALSLPQQMELYEKKLLRTALKDSAGNVMQAALRLGIPKKTLYDKLKRYEIGDFKPED
jgi:two-component system, NtrC family, C4-dicarboxylate transport response regulator DctD